MIVTSLWCQHLVDKCTTTLIFETLAGCTSSLMLSASASKQLLKNCYNTHSCDLQPAQPTAAFPPASIHLQNRPSLQHPCPWATQKQARCAPSTVSSRAAHLADIVCGAPQTEYSQLRFLLRLWAAGQTQFDRLPKPHKAHGQRGRKGFPRNSSCTCMVLWCCCWRVAQ